MINAAWTVLANWRCYGSVLFWACSQENTCDKAPVTKIVGDRLELIIRISVADLFLWNFSDLQSNFLLKIDKFFYTFTIGEEGIS